MMFTFIQLKKIKLGKNIKCSKIFSYLKCDNATLYFYQQKKTQLIFLMLPKLF